MRIANDTPYGLTNYIQSEDGAKRNRVARRLRSGMVEMNGQFRGAGSPFGGMKASGNGREGGIWGLEGVPRSESCLRLGGGLSNRSTTANRPAPGGRLSLDVKATNDQAVTPRRIG